MLNFDSDVDANTNANAKVGVKCELTFISFHYKLKFKTSFSLGNYDHRDKNFYFVTFAVRRSGDTRSGSGSA